MLRRLLATSVVGVLIAGCGAMQGPKNPAKTRFAIAQFVEARVASLDGEHRDGNALITVCGTSSNTSWLCSSYYASANGIVTSVNEDVSDENAAYEANGDVRIRPANLVAGEGLRVVLTSADLRKLIERDEATSVPQRSKVEGLVLRRGSSPSSRSARCQACWRC